MLTSTTLDSISASVNVELLLLIIHDCLYLVSVINGPLV